jgi:type I restriction enzyme S subunit
MKWPVAPLSKIVRIVGGGTPSKANSAFWSGEIPWVSPKDMVSRDIWETQDHISENAVAESATQLVPAGSVLIVARSGILERFVPIAIAHVPVTLNQDMKAFLPATEALDNQFLAYFLESRSTELLARFVKRGATVHSLDMNKLQQLKVPIPPLLEQRRIVEILDQADALRKKRTEADAKAERVLPALFYKMFGDPVTNPKGWDQTPLKKLLRDSRGALQSGPFGSNLHNSDFVDEGTVFVVGIDNVHDTGFQTGRNRRITQQKYEELKKYKLEAGDVLITIMGTIGRTCVFPKRVGKAICTKHVYRVQTDQNLLDPEYLCVSIRLSPSVRVQLGSSITGQIVDAITSKDLKELIVDVPPIDMQRQFAYHKKSLDDEAVRRNDSRSKLDYLFDNLIHRAFSANLTAKWREAHIKEIMAEMEEQAKYLAPHGAHNQRENAVQQESLF